MGTDGRLALAARLLGAASLFLVGLIHLHEYRELYSTIPTIGPLFLLSFIGGTAVAVGLVLPLEGLFGRFGGPALVLLALLGIGQAVTQFVFLAISERRPLFGFQEPGYDPTAIFQARVAEVATVVFLTAFLAVRLVRSRRRAVASDAGQPTRQPASR
jgi:hypothetical protein